MDPEDYDVASLYSSAYYNDYYAGSLRAARVSIDHLASRGAATSSHSASLSSSPVVTSYPVSGPNGPLLSDILSEDSMLPGERLATSVDMSATVDLSCPVCEAPISAVRIHKGVFKDVFKIIDKSCDCPAIVFEP